MDSTINAFGGLFLILIAVACLIFNTIIIIIFYRRKTIRNQAVNTFLLILAIIDLASLIGWTLFTIVSVIAGEWLMGDGLCKFQEYFWSFFNILNMHILCILALERCLLIHRPSRHQEICTTRVILLLLLGILIFDAVIAAFPFMGWGVVEYFVTMFQCITNYEQNVRHMNFMLTMTFGIPVLIMLTAYIAIFVRLAIAKRHVASFGAIILEKNDEATGDSYSNRLKNQQMKFQNAGMKTKKPKLKDQSVVYTNKGYINDPESTDEENDFANDTVNRRVTKKVYYLSRNDYVLTRTFLLAGICNVILWMPYVILSYIWTYSQYTPIASAGFLLVTWLTFCGTFIKPLIYVASCETYRTAFTKTFKRQEYYKNKSRASKAENTKEGDLNQTNMKNYLL